MIITGLRAETELAKMLIEFQLDHNRQLEAELGPRKKHAEHVKRREQLSRQATDESDSGEKPTEEAKQDRPQRRGDRRERENRAPDAARVDERKNSSLPDGRASGRPTFKEADRQVGSVGRLTDVVGSLMICYDRTRLIATDQP